MNLDYLNNLSHQEDTFSFSLSEKIPFFDGHFPEQPILPAIVYIEICLLLLKEKDISIHQYEVVKSKFLKPLAPNTEVKVELKTSSSPYKFNWYVGDEIVAKVNLKS